MIAEPLAFIGASDLAGLLCGKSAPLACFLLNSLALRRLLGPGTVPA